MIKLETTFVSGDGGFSVNPLTYRQIERSEFAAIYERSREGRVYDYEVIAITVDPKGKVMKFPGGVTKVVEDDTEKYPPTGKFGVLAWSAATLKQAKKRYATLLKSQISPEEVQPQTFVIPNGEFTVNELASKNNIGYPDAAAFIKASLANNTIIFVKEERRNLKGKPSKIYKKA